MRNLIIILIVIGITSCLTNPAMRDNYELRTKIEELEKEVKQLKGDTSVMITSRIAELTPNYRNMPIYCDPNQYSIAKIGTNYYVRLPGGTLGYKSYKTAEEVQKEINYWANISKKRWFETGGLDF
jgi:hypothetical protein